MPPALSCTRPLMPTPGCPFPPTSVPTSLAPRQPPPGALPLGHSLKCSPLSPARLHASPPPPAPRLLALTPIVCASPSSGSEPGQAEAVLALLCYGKTPTLIGTPSLYPPAAIPLPVIWAPTPGVLRCCPASCPPASPRSSVTCTSRGSLPSYFGAAGEGRGPHGGLGGGDGRLW